MGQSKKRRDDGTLSRPRICKPLYGLSQDDETGDWTDHGIGLCYGYVAVYLVVDKPQLQVKNVMTNHIMTGN